MDSLKIVFLGTPEFAVPSLQILLENRMNVVAVVTAPDKPQGRGQKIQFSPVKELALRNNIPVLQPTNLKSEDFQKTLNSFGADLQVVVAFRMLPQAIWAMPKLGTFNLHASLLPDYRGAAPINWAIINGEKETGVTTFFLKHEIDTGSIIFQEKEPILQNDTAGTLYERLMYRGASLVLKTVQGIAQGNVRSVPQSEPAVPKHAPKIFKETCEINWDQPSERVRDFIRGLSPHPAAFTTIHGKLFKIYSAEIIDEVEDDVPAGHVLTDNNEYLHFKTADKLISVTEIQAEGKKKMSVTDFFRGNKIHVS